LAEYFTCRNCGATRMPFAGLVCDPCTIADLMAQLKDAEEVIRLADEYLLPTDTPEYHDCSYPHDCAGSYCDILEYCSRRETYRVKYGGVK